MAYIEQRRNLWYATLTIPVDARARLGKFKFIQSLGTPDKNKAKVIAAPLIAKWKSIIRRERGEGDALINEALQWRAVLAETEVDNRAANEDAVVREAEEIEGKRGLTDAKRFADIALGRALPSDLHFDPWVAQLALAKKTTDQMQTDVRRMLVRFPMLQDITNESVRRWFTELAAVSVSPASLSRIASFCRNYWRYLQQVRAVPTDVQPFVSLSSKVKRSQRNKGWEPFAAETVVKLWTAAKKRKDHELADLVLLGAYSGARIEELCSLKTSEIAGHAFKVKDAKTAAGIREVPIHTKLRSTVTRLKRASKDGYLLSGLTPNKYGDRSNAIGKRFGRLKESLGFGNAHVFHSIRKTFVTLLERARVSENMAADIVGHEKPRITYGLYSGGASLAGKAKAVELVRYPGKMP